MTISSPPSNGLDLRIVFETPLRQFVLWLAMVVLVSLAGYPGVMCITPMAWLIALRVGNLCVARSRSEKSSQRLVEATLAGEFWVCFKGFCLLVLSPF